MSSLQPEQKEDSQTPQIVTVSVCRYHSSPRRSSGCKVLNLTGKNTKHPQSLVRRQMIRNVKNRVLDLPQFWKSEQSIQRVREHRSQSKASSS
mmetsp:Transcript_3130/g.5920  ORF Transcript_3130/g.5920 Transcript_3130/m.5920 type:complete len:93 (+) Transcript_3130:1858-2136(+)